MGVEFVDKVTHLINSLYLDFTRDISGLYDKYRTFGRKNFEHRP